METKFQTSFIPKQPVTDTELHSGSSASLFFLFSFILFMASLASAGAVFIYGSIVSKNIQDGDKQLTLNKNAFDPNTIKELTRLNNRINAANTLLKSHKGISTLFQVLSQTTLKNVRFTDFSYTAADDKINLGMHGQAFNYETIALQAKAFTDPTLKNVFRSPIFSDLTLDSQGNVSFNFNTGIDPFLVDYYKLKKEEYASGGAPQAAPQAPQDNQIIPTGFTNTSNQAPADKGVNSQGAAGAGITPAVPDAAPADNENIQ
jgi:hypothetical protein